MWHSFNSVNANLCCLFTICMYPWFNGKSSIPKIETLTAMHIKIVGLTCDRNKHIFTIFTSVGLGLANGHLKEKFEGYKNVEQTHAKSSWLKQVYIIFRPLCKRESWFRNQETFCLRNPESSSRNPTGMQCLIWNPMRGIQNARLSWIPLLLYALLGVCLSVQRDSIGLRSLTYDKHWCCVINNISHLLYLEFILQ